ncbi:MAG: hypothetical protein ACREOU_12980 [Candidatus Eiseniibacteriota bacterium]
MKLTVRLSAFVLVVALSLAWASRPGHAGGPPAPTAKTCYFLRNNLPCPCPSAQKARAVANAARVTARALGNAFGTTAAALSRAERNHGAVDSRNASQRNADPRNASEPAQPQSIAERSPGDR